MALSGKALGRDGDAVTRDEFLEWVKKDAIHVQDWQMNPELSAYLDKALESKRIIFVGEPGHFFSEKYDVQLMLIRHLSKKGYRHIFLEGLGASMAPVVDKFVTKGERTGTEREKSSREVVEYEKRALMGMVGADDPEFKKRHSAAQRRFYRELHKISESLVDDGGPLRIHPLDIDMKAGGCSMSITRLLARYPDQPSLDPIRKLAERIKDETSEEKLARLERLMAAVSNPDDPALAAMKQADRLRLRNFADCWLETVAFFKTARADGKLDGALVRREPAMFRQVKYAMDGLPADAKAIMLAHSNHLCRIGADVSRARDPSVGEMIDNAFPGQVFSIWMLHDHGTLLNPMSKEVIETLESSPQRIESIMIQAGSRYVLPLHSTDRAEGYLDQKRQYSYFSWSETGTLTRQTDALFFLDEITPLTQ